jgi:hypothetical protein
VNQIDIAAKTKELKQYIAQFETVSFVTQYYYLLNRHLRTDHKILKLESPLRQIQYLLSLFLQTSSDGPKRVYDPVTGDHPKIEGLLHEIEAGYRYNYIESIKPSDLNEQVVSDHIMVANQTFLNYFVNGELNFVEQEIDRIERTFRQFDGHIQSKTGCSLDDFLYFFEVTDFVDSHQLRLFLEAINSEENLELLSSHETNGNFQGDEFSTLFTNVENDLYKLPFNRVLLHAIMEETAVERVEKLLDIFACSREESHSELFYTDSYSLIQKPIVQLNNDFFIIPCQKQLIHATYDFLYEVCGDINKQKQLIGRTRDIALEDKVTEIFSEFFDGKARVYRNYYINGAEKDLLVLYRNTAFIIECKANKIQEPLRDPSKAFIRIKHEFKKSIQLAYDQAREVKEAFQESRITIKDRKGNIVDTIVTSKYYNRFIIAVTGERFGQIQCDLGLLLELAENETEYPWSAYVDDLETFFLTLKRKSTAYGDLIAYLNLRERLHERLACFDELELCSYFLISPDEFRKYCTTEQTYLFSSPDMHSVFDWLYQTGIGFKYERNLEQKINSGNVKSMTMANALGLKRLLLNKA